MRGDEPMPVGNVAPSERELRAIYDLKYAQNLDLGWGPRTRLKFGHFSPDEHYEAVVAKVLSDGCQWVDVGCGREIFPSNPKLAAQLAKRAGSVLGIDPDDNILENRMLTEIHHGTMETYSGSRKADLITFRMVAEHIEDPPSVIDSICRISHEGTVVVVFTPGKWSPMSVLAKITSTETHHVFKRLLWETEEKDTFPVQYKMNTRRDLCGHFERKGFDTIFFQYLNDCRTFNRFRILNLVELSLWKLLVMLRLPYPERCILAVFRKR